MTNFQERLAVGVEHEQRVAEELAIRGWTVDPWGQGVLTSAVRSALQGTDSALRWTPDMIAARGELVVLIDAKGTTSPDSGRHAVSRDAVRAHLQFAAWTDTPVYYVFSDLGVLTPHEVMACGRSGPHLTIGRRGPYYLVSAAMCRSFDHVFGGLQEAAARWAQEKMAA
jgi:Holliday junction resolvase